MGKSDVIFSRLLIVFGVVGLFSMIYLTLSFSAGVIPQNSCSIKGTILDCSKVVTSQYSRLFFGISNYYLGAAFFVLIIVLSILIILKPERSVLGVKLTHAVLILSAFGAVLAVYLIYLELEAIGAICIMCTAGQVSIFSLLAISMLWFREKRRNRL